jgi:hypothetical protein
MIRSEGAEEFPEALGFGLTGWCDHQSPSDRAKYSHNEKKAVKPA